MPTALNVSLLSDADTWLNVHMPPLVAAIEARGHAVTWVHTPAELPEGDVAFYLSCTRLVSPALLARHRHNLVVHQSALPQGRGWSPLAWQILEGRQEVPVSLIEAEPEVDSGVIYLQDTMRFTGSELIDDLRAAQAAMNMRLVLAFLDRFPAIVAEGRPQTGEPSYYPRRRADASRLDPDLTLREQFNVLRIADNDRYPAYFDHGGETYVLRIEKARPTEGWVTLHVPQAEPAASLFESAEPS